MFMLRTDERAWREISFVIVMLESSCKYKITFSFEHRVSKAAKHNKQLLFTSRHAAWLTQSDLDGVVTGLISSIPESNEQTHYAYNGVSGCSKHDLRTRQ